MRKIGVRGFEPPTPEPIQVRYQLRYTPTNLL